MEERIFIDINQQHLFHFCAPLLERRTASTRIDTSAEKYLAMSRLKFLTVVAPESDVMVKDAELALKFMKGAVGHTFLLD